VHAGDGLLGVERQQIAAGKLHGDVRVGLSRLGNAIERRTSLAKIGTTAEVNDDGMAGH
jgi:hypothetical protein